MIDGIHPSGINNKTGMIKFYAILKKIRILDYSDFLGATFTLILIKDNLWQGDLEGMHEYML